MPPEEQVHRHINDRPDSIEIGSPSKGGVVKVYFNAAADVQEIKNLIDQAFNARKYAQGKYDAQQEGKP
jgi:hypothetical protein